jgi:hypothetical protein
MIADIQFLGQTGNLGLATLDFAGFTPIDIQFRHGKFCQWDMGCRLPQVMDHLLVLLQEAPMLTQLLTANTLDILYQTTNELVVTHGWQPQPQNNQLVCYFG